MFVKTTDGTTIQYPYTLADLRRDNPNTSFPEHIPDEVLASYGVYSVGYQGAPAYDDKTHRLDHGEPKLIDGSWVIPKEVVVLTKAQVESNNANKAKGIRNKRNSLLIETDYMAMSDVVMSKEMKAYRKALRDLSKHANFPHLSEEDWPVKP